MTRFGPAARAAVGSLVVLLGAACSSAAPVARPASPPPPAVSTSAPRVHPAYAAVVQDSAAVHAAAGGSGAPILTLASHNENGAPQTMLVRAEQSIGWERWYQVLLPVRPNGSTGWVQDGDVHLVGLAYRIVVDLSAFELELFEGDELLRKIRIGVGTDQTPTPGGLYYLKELLRPPDQTTVYGHYVFGLSGFSNVLTDWPGGGVLGIHGTNDPATLGQRVSHGCVRMHNDDITYLAALLPLGTPVTVLAT